MWLVAAYADERLGDVAPACHPRMGVGRQYIDYIVLGPLGFFQAEPGLKASPPVYCMAPTVMLEAL